MSNLEINIGVNVTGKPQVDQLKSTIDDLSPTAREAGKASIQAGQGMVGMGDGATKANANLGDTRRGLVSISTQLNEMKTGLDRVQSALLGGFSFNQFVQAAAQMEQMASGLRAVSGDANLAKEQMEFVRQVAFKSGVDVVEASKAFLGLAASTKGTAVEGEPARAVFEAVATSMAKAGKSSAETNNALLALSQMAGKGVVQMEELRGQLGEALPGALQATAKGMGITTQDLIKLVESGQVAAQDLFPALTKGLKEMYGTAPAAQTLSQELTNVKNSFTQMASDIGEAGAVDALKVGAEVAQAAFVYLGDSLIQTGKYLGILAGAAASMDFSHVTEEFDKVEKESRVKLLKAAEHNTVLAASIRMGGTEAAQMGLKAQEAGDIVAAAASGAGDAGPKYIALANAYQKVRDEVAGSVKQIEKSTEARTAEAKNIQDTANAYGTENEKRKANADAANMQATAQQALADIKKVEVEVMKAELAAKQLQLESDGKVSDERKKELKELKDLIDLKQADAEKATAQAAASRIVQERTALEVATYQDNSARLGELRDAYERARQKLEELQRQKKAGLPVEKELEQADKAAATAALLYRDALSDTVEKLKAKQTAMGASNQVILASLNVQKSYHQAVFDQATAEGNHGRALQAKISMLQIDIMTINAKARAMYVEAEGNIAVAKAELAVLDASGKVDPVRRAQIEASIQLAQAKKLEADATGMGSAAIQAQIDMLRSGEQALDGFSSASNKAADAQNNLAGAVRGVNSAASGSAEKGKSSASTGITDLKVPEFKNQEQADEWLKQADSANSTGPYAQVFHQWSKNFYDAGLKQMRDREAMQKATDAGEKKKSDMTQIAQSRTVTVRLQNPDGKVNVVNTNDQGASGIIDAFKSAKLAAGY